MIFSWSLQFVTKSRENSMDDRILSVTVRIFIIITNITGSWLPWKIRDLQCSSTSDRRLEKTKWDERSFLIISDFRTVNWWEWGESLTQDDWVLGTVYHCIPHCDGKYTYSNWLENSGRLRVVNNFLRLRREKYFQPGKMFFPASILMMFWHLMAWYCKLEANSLNSNRKKYSSYRDCSVSRK